MRTMFLVFLMLSSSLAGCFGEEEKEEVIPQPSVWDFEKSDLTWYHFAEAQDAYGNTSFDFDGRNVPYHAIGTYYGIGMSTFEPTMGITQSDMMMMSSYGNGPAGSTAIISCDLIGMHDVLDYSCENIYDPFLPIANSNDPYIYIDPWTSRIMKFDMHALLGMTVEWSDDEGASWNGPSVATQIYSVQDHQTIASSNMPALLHPTTWMFCINGNAPHPLCSSSQDGGAPWGPETSRAPVSSNSGRITAH